MKSLTRFARSHRLFVLFLAAAIVIGPTVMPTFWSGNEIVYFDLAYRTVQPEAFSDRHAMFDSSNARIVGMAVIGFAVDVLGYEMAKTALALACWVLLALGAASCARALGLNALGLAFALLAFLLAGQDLMGGEWIFGTVETKVFSYICVFFAFGAALKQKWMFVLAMGVLATYFHFLVGGVWTAFLLLLGLMRDRAGFAFIRLIGIYLLCVSPIIAVLVFERIGSDVNASSFELSLDEIYATIRAPHHVAPFALGWVKFASLWLPGLVMHIVLAIALFWTARNTESDRVVFNWAGVLNLTLPLAMVVAYFDSDTHVFAKFLIFRPSAPVFLLSCLLLAGTFLRAADMQREPLPGVAILIGLAILFPQYMRSVGEIALRYPPDARLVAQISDGELMLVEWVKENTPEGAAILLEPGAEGLRNRYDAFTQGAERLTQRGMIVDFKNVPSDAADLARWYTLLLARAEFFEGDCTRLSELRADFVVFRTDEARQRLSGCTDVVAAPGGYKVARVVD